MEPKKHIIYRKTNNITKRLPTLPTKEQQPTILSIFNITTIIYTIIRKRVLIVGRWVGGGGG